MSLLHILQLGLSVTIALLLRPYLALLVQFIAPGVVKHRFQFVPLPDSDEVQELLDEGYRYLGCRTESIPLLMSARSYVFGKPGGIFIDLHAGNLSKLYMVSATEGGVFVLTRNYGFGSFSRGTYYSTRVEGEYPQVAAAHANMCGKHSLGEPFLEAESSHARLSFAARWYGRHCRRELMRHAFLALVLLVLGGAMIYRLWSVT